MSNQADVDAAIAWFTNRQRLLFEVIEGARYDLGRHVEALREVVSLIRTAEIGEALEVLEHEVASVDALLLALSSGDGPEDNG